MLQITTSVTRVTSVPRVVSQTISLRQHALPLRKPLHAVVVTEINSPQARQRAAGVYREPVVTTQKQPLPRSAGNRHHLARAGRSLNDEPGDDARIIVDVELSAPDATAQGLVEII